MIDLFNIGDKVIANKLATSHYRITCEGWVGTVCRLVDETTIEVTDESVQPHYPFVVNSACFDLLEPAKLEQDDEFLSMMFDVGEVKCLSN